VALNDARTGAIIGQLLPFSRNGMHVAGLSLDRSGNVWITYTRGPFYRNDTENGDPRPGSCANEIAVWHARTGKVTTFLRTSDHVLLSGAVLSPDGRMLAYSYSGCTTGPSYLRVTSLATGRSWNIGQGVGRCDLITNPSWTADSRALLVGYAPSVRVAHTVPKGRCPGLGRERLVRLSAAKAQAGVTGATAAARPGCKITSVAGLANGGALAVEACGGPYDISGPARLLVLDARLRQVRQFTLGRCTDGNELSANRTGKSVLISAYLFCNPPGRPGPVTRLWRYDGGAPRLLTTVPGGQFGVSLMTW
jgi:hypothetical protein